MSWLEAIGYGLEAYGIWQQGQSANDSAQAEASNVKEVAEHNAQISLLDASIAAKDAALAESAYGYKVRQQVRVVDKVLGAAKAGFAKSGVVASSGSALDTLVDIAKDGAEDVALIASEGRTAFQRGKDIERRYKLLAEYGLRDAAFQASMLESAGADMLLASQIKTGSVVAEGIFDFGQDEGWWA